MNKFCLWIKGLGSFVIEIYEKRYLISELVRRDFKSRYLGSTLGLLWAILQPCIMMLIMWFVFTFGLKAGSGAGGIPYICYLFTGNLAWNFFSDSVFTSTGSIREYSFLVKKINFRLSILPLVKILSALILHLVFFIIVAVVLLVNGIYPSVYWLQIPYYCFCLMIMSLGISWMTSSMNVFTRDISYIVSILLQFGFWLTPIFWDMSAFPANLHVYAKLNPMYYIVSGYRDCLLYQKPFWQADLFSTMVFWIFTLVVLFFGVVVFKKLRPHFADVI